MFIKICITALVICLTFSPQIFSIEIAIITNKSSNIEDISLKTLRKIYLKKKLFINGQKVIPVNLSSSSKLRKIFQEKVLKMDEEELNIYWNEICFNGTSPPLVLSSEKAVLDFVKKIKNAIGYVSADKVDKEVKVIRIIEVKDNGRREEI